MAVSSVIGLVPAVLLLYVLLSRYEGLFDERKVFFLFAIGLVVGMIITVFHMASDDFLLSAIDLAILFFVFGFALLESLIKLVILNIKRFQLKYETVYYGANLGLGIGSMAIIAISYREFLSNPDALGEALTVVGFVVLSFNFCLIHSSTGIIIGYGVSTGQVFGKFTRAWMLHAFFNLFLMLFLWTTEAVKMVLLVIMTFVALVIMWYVVREVLPKAVPKELLKKKRRERRKRTREAVLGPQIRPEKKPKPAKKGARKRKKKRVEKPK